MKTIVFNLIFYLLVVGVGYIFTGELHWFFAIAMLLIGGLQSLFIWLFIDPEFGKRQQRRLIERLDKRPEDQNNPSI